MPLKSFSAALQSGILSHLGDFLNALCNFGSKSKWKYQQPRHTCCFLQLVWKVIESNTANEKCWVMVYSTRKPPDYPHYSSSKRMFTQDFSQGLLKWNLSPLVQLRWGCDLCSWLLLGSTVQVLHRDLVMCWRISLTDSGLITSHFYCCKLWGLSSCWVF